MDTTTTTESPAPEGENLQGKGGTMEFEAAAGLAQAFEKMKTGPEEAPSSEEGMIGEPGHQGPEGEAGEKGEDQSADDLDVPTAEDLAKLRGVKLKPKVEEPNSENEELPKEAASLKKWALGMKKDWKAERAKREELEAKLSELEKNSVNTEELTKLREQNEAYERELQISRVEATQEFRDAVVAPMRQIREDIDALAIKYEVAPRDIFEALSEENPSARSDKLSDLVAGMNDRDKYNLYELEKRFSKVESTREKVVAHAKLALQKIQEHREQEFKNQQSEAAKRYEAAFSQVWEATQNNLPLLRRVEGDDEWNKVIDDISKTAQTSNFETLNEVDRARVAVRAAAAPLLASQFIGLYHKYQEVIKSLEKYQKATPKAGGGGSAPAAPPKEEFEDFMSALKANLR